MKLIIPIVLTKIDKKLILPLHIFKSRDGISSYIENFTIEEKEQYFKIVIHEINQKEHAFTYDITGLVDPNMHLKFRDYIITPYKLVISKQTENPSELQKEKDIIEFVFKVIVGCGLPVLIITDTKTMFNGAASTANDDAISRKDNKIIDENTLRRIQRLIELLHSDSVDRDKIDLLKFLLSVAMSPVPLGIGGAFYVSILESIFVRDKDSEIGYRFSMRMSKMRNSNEDYRNKIKKLI